MGARGREGKRKEEREKGGGEGGERERERFIIHGRRQVFESGGANDVFLLEITSIAHFCHAHQSFDS